MNAFLYNFLSFIAGLILGLFYFGGLHMTIKQMENIKSQGLVSFLSFAIRSLVVIVGFYLLGKDDFIRIIFAVLGFFVALLTYHIIIGIKYGKE